MVSGRDVSLELDDAKLLAECEVHTYRSRGPGGQKRNKTESAVRLKHVRTGLTTVGTESRSQHENKARALRRLRLAIALEERSDVDLSGYARGEVLAGCVSREGRLVVGRRDARYPLVVASVLDVLAAAGGRVGAAADALGITTGNLNKFFVSDPKVWESVNRLRERFGRDRLKRRK